MISKNHLLSACVVTLLSSSAAIVAAGCGGSEKPAESPKTEKAAATSNAVDSEIEKPSRRPFPTPRPRAV
jgi:hypothetical protein